MVDSWYSRTGLLVGEDGLLRLGTAHVLVVGLGGVGGFAAEMLVRAGVGRLTIVDGDLVSLSNLNRQLVALGSTIGKSKACVLGDRLLDINGGLSLRIVDQYVSGVLIDELLDFASYDWVVDCIDSLSPKVALIRGCLVRGYRLVSSMGCGGKFDPSLVCVGDISVSYQCPLAHAVRRRLHRYGIREGFSVVYSSERPVLGSTYLCDQLHKRSGVGNISYLVGIFGCYVSSVVLRGLLGRDL